MASVMKPTAAGKSRLAGTMGKVADLAGVPDKNRHISPHMTMHKPNRINLKRVAEVLESRGMDPTEELVNILRPVDKDGNAVPSKLPADIQARILNELLQYTQPKLKSIEIKGRLGVAGFNPTDAQARAMAEEFLLGQVAEQITDDEQGED